MSYNIIIYDDGRLLRQLLLARAENMADPSIVYNIYIDSPHTYIIPPILTDPASVSIWYYNNNNNNSFIPTNIRARSIRPPATYYILY